MEPKSNWLLFGILLFTFGYFYQGGFANQNSRFDLSLALSFQGTFQIDTFHENTVDKVRHEGHYYSEKAPGSAYLALPVPWLASHIFGLDDLLQIDGLADSLLYLATLFSVSLLSALAAVVFRRFLHALNPDRTQKESLLLTVAVSLGTLAFPYSTMLFSHQIAGSLLLMGAALGYRAATQKTAHPLAGHLASFLLGAAVWVEYPAIFVAGAIGIGLFLVSDDRVSLMRFVPAAILPALAILLHNYLSFRDPLSLGYGKLQGTAFASQMSEGFFGVRLPRPERLAQLLFGSYRGLFFYSPLLILGFASLGHLPRGQPRRFLIPALIGCCLLLLLNSSYAYWQGGVCFGPRHLVPAIPIVALLFAFTPSRWLKHPTTLAVVVLSVSINLVGTATTPFVSEYDTNPLLQSYATLARNAGISLNPNGFLITNEEGQRRWQKPENYPNSSWNLGEKIGLSGWLSLLPLLGVWLLYLLGILLTAASTECKRARKAC